MTNLSNQAAPFVDAVARWDATVASLTGLHRDAWLPWDWERVRASPAPEEPPYPSVAEPRAQAALDGYRPSVLDRLRERDVVRRAELEADLEAARAADRATFVAALEAHCIALDRWQWYGKLAAGVLAGASRAYEAAIAYLTPFGLMREVFGDMNVQIIHPLCAEARFVARGIDAVPREAPVMRGDGSVELRPLRPTKRLAMHRDHLASAALRVGREIFGLLPIELALVHVGGRVLNRSTGHEELRTLLSVALSRATMARLRFDTLDPAEALCNFVHRLDFARLDGARPVQALTPGELRCSFALGASECR